MTVTGKPAITGLYHVGLHAKDPSQMAAFYRDIIGMQIVSNVDDPMARMVFLSSRPSEEAHELVFTSNPELAHIAFKVETLADLRAFYQHIVEKGLPIEAAFNHGASLAFYFRDLESNLIEIYWPTDLASKQPDSYPLDLTLPETAIRESMAELAAHQPDGRPHITP
ncbi:MAG: VOC family protein [Anaerolineaceae bacterium]|nr:VOC family protein [Anaerolineaceae bacterium]MCB9099455.1 VOC family protein [Anaerolineales bacterium]